VRAASANVNAGGHLVGKLLADATHLAKKSRWDEALAVLNRAHAQATRIEERAPWTKAYAANRFVVQAALGVQVPVDPAEKLPLTYGARVQAEWEAAKTEAEKRNFGLAVRTVEALRVFIDGTLRRDPRIDGRRDALNVETMLGQRTAAQLTASPDAPSEDDLTTLRQLFSSAVTRQETAASMGLVAPEPPPPEPLGDDDRLTAHQVFVAEDWADLRQAHADGTLDAARWKLLSRYRDARIERLCDGVGAASPGVGIRMRGVGASDRDLVVSAAKPELAVRALRRLETSVSREYRRSAERVFDVHPRLERRPPPRSPTAALLETRGVVASLRTSLQHDADRVDAEPDENIRRRAVGAAWLETARALARALDAAERLAASVETPEAPLDLPWFASIPARSGSGTAAARFASLHAALEQRLVPLRAAPLPSAAAAELAVDEVRRLFGVDTPAALNMLLGELEDGLEAALGERGADVDEGAEARASALATLTDLVADVDPSEADTLEETLTALGVDTAAGIVANWVGGLAAAGELASLGRSATVEIHLLRLRGLLAAVTDPAVKAPLEALLDAGTRAFDARRAALRRALDAGTGPPAA
jgi:hypothetical protein